MKLSERALAIVNSGYRWTAEDHRISTAQVLERLHERRLMRALFLRAHPGWKLCNLHGSTCRDQMTP